MSTKQTFAKAGLGGDVPGFTDTQWYMYHQKNIAFFAAFSTLSYDHASVASLVRELLVNAPQLRTGLAGNPSDSTVSDEVIRRLASIEQVEDFSGFPDVWLNQGDDLLTADDLPLFRVRIGLRENGPDALGRRAYIQVRVTHALVEGMDSALLTRSRSARHSEIQRTSSPSSANLGASLVGGFAAFGHLLAGNFYQPNAGAFGFATRELDRSAMGSLARTLGVRQRALLFAIVMATLFDAGSANAKAKISSTYSTIDDQKVTRDSFMRMRMLFATFANAPTVGEFVRSVDAQLARSEGQESGFGSAMNAAALRMHRRLSRILPFAYRPQLFAFMPFDIILGLIPPHRLDGPLTKGLIEPVYAGAETEGGNACVIVPGRKKFTLNFYLQTTLLPKVSRLEGVLAAFESASR